MEAKKKKKRKKKRRLKPHVSGCLIGIVSAIAGSMVTLWIQGCENDFDDKGAPPVKIFNTNADDISCLFDDHPNPYLNKFDSMPDDNCVRMKINYLGANLGKVFNDSNHVHLEPARQLGIEPITDINSAWNLRRPIVEIESCEDFYVDELTHSYPFLVPEAADLLHEIGQNFNQALRERGGGDYRIKVTSVLRTPETVRKLRRVNRNATEESAHQYGTTFDISYVQFACDNVNGIHRTQEDMKNLLGEVLNELRNQGRCYVKYERKQGCYHITVR